MSVLIVTPDIVGPVRNGGIGTACFHYARALVSAGIETAILYTSPLDAAAGARWKADYASRGIALFTLADLPAAPWKCYSFGPADERSHGIYRFLRERPFRYVLFQDWHANGFWATRARRMGLALAGTTLGIIAHASTQWQREGMASIGLDPLLEASIEWQEREAIAAADILVSPSRHMVDWLTSHGYDLPPEVALCPPTFEDPVAEAPPGPVDKQHLIFFGRLETRKGLHLFADAMRALHREGRDLPRKVTFLGRHAPVAGTSSEQYLKALISDVPGIDYAVESDLHYPDALALIRRERGVLVMPSTLDNFPLTIVEAVANRFAFITSTAGGIPEGAAPEVLFAPTVAALKHKLVELPGIDFAAIRHPYVIAEARRNWVDHVKDKLAAPLPAPHLGRADDDGVSVCIPFYNFDRYLPRLVSAFLKDRDQNLQLVLVNDGTPEADCPTFHRYARELGPIGHVFHTQDNAGAGAARNKAAALARHRRLVFFDADNVPFPDFVRTLRRARAGTGADSISVPFLAVPPFARQPLPGDVLYAYIAPGGPLAASLHTNHFGDTCSLQHRDVFEKLGGFREDRSYFDDWEYYLRLAAHGYRHLVLPDPGFYYAFDPAGRRAEIGLDAKFATLWGSLAGLPAGRLAEIVELLARHLHVKRP